MADTSPMVGSMGIPGGRIIVKGQANADGVATAREGRRARRGRRADI